MEQDCCWLDHNISLLYTQLMDWVVCGTVAIKNVWVIFYLIQCFAGEGGLRVLGCVQCPYPFLTSETTDQPHRHLWANCLGNAGASASQPCGPLQPVTGIALPLPLTNLHVWMTCTIAYCQKWSVLCMGSGYIITNLHLLQHSPVAQVPLRDHCIWCAILV
jgi:hypothetical protein